MTYSNNPFASFKIQRQHIHEQVADHIEAMIAEHRIIAELVEVVRYAYHPVRAAAAGEALRVLFDTHVAKEDGIVYPLVAAVPGLSLENILAGLHDILTRPEVVQPRSIE